ncbi:MAG TPA: hypothetical protein VN028_08555, partial [Rhodocyclaceae bacterium]|nr:hypothetical protein [Rhodocyclaceae bacterium]
VQAAGLLLKGSGAVTLTNGSNDFDTLAISRSSGTMSVRTNGALSIGSVGGTAGVNTSGSQLTLNVGGALSQSQALTAGGLELISSSGTVTLNNANNSFTGLAMNVHGDTTLRNKSSTLYTRKVGSTTGIDTHGNDLTLTNTNTLSLGNGSTSGAIDVGGGVLDISSRRIVQYGDSAVTADQLVLRSSNFAGLSGTTNSVNTLAVVATGSGGGALNQAFDFWNGKSLTIGTVNGVAGITTANAHGKVEAKGNITVANDIDTGSGHLALFAQNGGSYYTVDTGSSTIKAGALAVIGNDLKLDRDGDGVNNATGKLQTKVIAIRSGGGFGYTAANDLTISSNVWGLSGITAANGNVYIKTGKFSGYSLATDYSDYYDSATGKYKAGLILDGGITAKNHTIYLNSGSGVFQWASDNSASPPTKRSQAKLEATRLMLAGEGQFSLLLADNVISQFAASTKGSILLADSVPLTIDKYSFNAYGVSSTLTGVRTTASLIDGSVAGGDAEYNAHNILIASSDDPNAGSNLAMDIRQDIVASTLGSGTVNLSVGASDNHKDALVRTSNGAFIRGSVMVLGGAEDRGTFDIDSNVASMSAAGGRSMLIDNTAYTGTLNVLGLGSSQGGGAPTPVGNVFLSTGGAMTLLGGKSTGNYLQLRANQLDVLGTMEMKDGARVLLQPLDMSYDIGVNHASSVDINYSTGLLQRFSQTAAIYVGSTPALMNQDSAVPGVVRNLVSTGKIRIGSNLQLGYRSLSAETSSQILANYIGDVYNLRLVAPSVSIQGFNVTGTQVHIFTDNLSMNSAASQYKLASNTEVTLRGYRNRTVWVGYRGNSQEAGFTEALLKKFPDGTHIIISGSTDQQL